MNYQLVAVMQGWHVMLALGAFIVFSLYVADKAAEGPDPDGRRWFELYRVKAALAILVHFSGECVTRGSLWWTRHHLNAGDDAGWIGAHQDETILVGMIISSVGTLMMIFLFAPEGWRARWMAAISIVAAIVVVALEVW